MAYFCHDFAVFESFGLHALEDFLGVSAAEAVPLEHAFGQKWQKFPSRPAPPAGVRQIQWLRSCRRPLQKYFVDIQRFVAEVLLLGQLFLCFVG